MSREGELFDQALDLPPAEREAFLDRACGDDLVLRDRMSELFEAYSDSAQFMVDSGVAALDPHPPERPGDVIGRYTLIRKIGEGGCGDVYLAEQFEPVRRQVALKVIKLGMDTREVIARFEQERQALAMMDHPDIARVFDAGATVTGRPYFVMEFVDGVPITTYCDQKQLSVPARLELFARVCLALQHAHQKGIIHRDVKPSNILVTEHDGVALPKVIDFGIAKATEGRLTEATLLTGFDQFMGTPAYMSPEQAELRELDIDTRSDVYALGVLLYELLTGRPPFDPKSLIQAGIAEIRRIIREVEPTRPSAFVATLTDADRTTIAQHRRAGATRLRSALQGDLDWIVMRCLEKDRARRYSTANELADDVRRHLRSEPVNARPPGAGYLARKFVRRHRYACGAAAAVAASLILGTVVSVMQAVRATRAEKDATRRQEQAEDVLAFMLGDFRSALQKIGRLSLLDAVGDKAMAYFAELSPRDITDTALARKAKALTQIGQIRMDQARYDEAYKAFFAAYAGSAALVERHPRNPDRVYDRAQAEFWIGFVAWERKDIPEARLWLTRYRDTAQTLATIDGKTRRAQLEVSSGLHNLAVLDCEDGKLASARIGFEAEAAALQDMLSRDPSNSEVRAKLADVASWLGRVAETDGRYLGALDDYRLMLARYEDLARVEPDVAQWRMFSAQAEMWVGNALIEVGRWAEARSAYGSARSNWAELLAGDPANRSWQANAAHARIVLVQFDFLDGDLTRARTEVVAARERLVELQQAEPESQRFKRLSAMAWRLEADYSLAGGEVAGAEAAIDRSLSLAESLVAERPRDPQVVGEFARTSLVAGRISRILGRADEAPIRWERARVLLEPFLADINDARVLEPAVQIFAMVGDAVRARSIAARLSASGYHSLDPSFSSLLERLSQSNSNN